LAAAIVAVPTTSASAFSAVPQNLFEVELALKLAPTTVTCLTLAVNELDELIDIYFPPEKEYL
jgi:hypothetical protein